MSGRDPVAYKILDAADWAAFQTDGVYGGSAVDRRDGYIHMSAADQLAGTAEKHYAGRTGLRLLTIDLAACGDALVWEPSRGAALFPHLYADLPLAAVTAARAFAVSPDGALTFDDGGAA